MGKIIGAVAMIGLAIGAALVAGPLGGLIVKGLGSIGIAVSATVGTAIASVAISLAIGLAMMVLAPPPGTRAQPFNWRNSVSNAWIIIGKRRQGGLMVFFHPRKSGSTHYRYFIFAAAGHRCHGMTQWMLNDEVVTVDGSGKVTSAGPWQNKAWLWFGRGQYDVDETPAGWRSEVGSKWSTDHIGYGVAKIYAKFEMTDDTIQAGMPTISAVIEGSDEIVDPRTGEPGYTDLAVPAFYWWMQLPREEGGFGARADEIPDDELLALWTNICDEDVDDGAEGTEKRWTFDALIEAGAEPSKVRETFKLCCAGSYTFSGGKHLLRPGCWVPPTATLDEADLSGAIQLPLLNRPEEYATEVTGTFIDPAVGYQPQPVPTRRIESDDIRQLNFELAHCTSHARGQRILEIMLRRGQCEKRLTWPMNIKGIELRAMQTVQCATSRYGLSNYAFVIDEWGLASSFAVQLALREENEDIYAEPTLLPKSGVASPDVAEPVDVTPPVATSAGQVSDGTDSYSAAAIKALEERIEALEAP